MQREEKEGAYFLEKKKINQRNFTLGHLPLIVTLSSRVIGVQNP